MNKAVQTVCITGATGFLGQHLIEKLKFDERYLLNLLTRETGKKISNQIHYIPGDLLNRQSLDEFIKPGAIVIHLAYLDEDSFSKNKIALESLINVCKKNQVKQFIHISTAVVVGRVTENLITEDTLCNPLTSYEKNKIACETTLINNLSQTIPLTILRPTAIFGENGKNLNKLINDFLTSGMPQKLLKGLLLSNRPLHLVHINNVVSAILFAIAHPAKLANHDCFIISDDDEICNTYSAFYEIIAEITQTKPKKLLFYLPSFLQKLLLRLKGNSQINPEQRFSSQKIIQCGFHKEQNLEAHLRDYIKTYINQKGAL